MGSVVVKNLNYSIQCDPKEGQNFFQWTFIAVMAFLSLKKIVNRVGQNDTLA